MEDSKIYKLLFRVVHECEQYFKINSQYVSCSEMTNPERFDLMQQNLNALKVRSRKVSLVSGAKQQLVSCISSPTSLDKVPIQIHDPNVGGKVRSVSNVDLINGQIETITQVNPSDQFYDPTAKTSKINQNQQSERIYHE